MGDPLDLFTEWARTGKLRRPRFAGPRRDPDPHDVRRERAEESR